MDVLNAETIPVDGRVYRLIKTRNSVTNTEENDYEPTIRTDVYQEDDYDPELPIMHQGNTFYMTFHVPNQIFGFIKGHRNNTLRLIEQNGAKVVIPRNKEDTGITISGSNKTIVSVAYYKIMDKVTIARLRTESTHFVSLPVNFPNIQESFLKFKEAVLEKHKGVRGINENIFQKPTKMHITVSVLVLLDERDNQNAIAILKKCMDNILEDLGEKEFRVHVKGIEYMNDDPSEVDVLYAKVEELDGDNRLQIVADSIKKEFEKASLSRSQSDRVKLHITLMNTLFRDKLESKSDDQAERITFDARPLIKDFKNFDFGQIVISEIHISVRYTVDKINGYYLAIHKMNL